MLQYCILDVWICILDVWTRFLGFWCLGLYFKCLDLHLLCLDLFFEVSGLVSRCLDLYVGCPDLFFSVYLWDVTMPCALGDPGPGTRACRPGPADPDPYLCLSLDDEVCRMTGISGFPWNINVLLHKWTPQAIYPSRRHIQLYVVFWISRQMSLEKSWKVCFGDLNKDMLLEV